jgi:hypothetical protein
MMTDYRYRFDDEAAAIAALPDYRVDQVWKHSGEGFCLDPIGVLSNEAGWHLNLRVWDGRVNPCAEATVTPQEPQVVWMD